MFDVTGIDGVLMLEQADVLDQDSDRTRPSDAVLLPPQRARIGDGDHDASQAEAERSGTRRTAS